MAVPALATIDAVWTGTAKHCAALASAIYFTFAFAASRYSLWLELRLRVGR